MTFTLTFFQLFINILYLALPLLFSFITIIIILGQLVGRIEQWSVFNALYWSFITALTVGYGDMKPTHKISKTLSIFIGLIGIVFTGIIVAIAIATATRLIELFLTI